MFANESRTGPATTKKPISFLGRQRDFTVSHRLTTLELVDGRAIGRDKGANKSAPEKPNLVLRVFQLLVGISDL
jgi:hypothetical protein